MSQPLTQTQQPQPQSSQPGLLDQSHSIAPTNSLNSIRQKGQKYGPTILGVQKFVNIRDLAFMNKNKNQPFLKQHKQYLESFERKIMWTGSVVPLSLMVVVGIRRAMDWSSRSFGAALGFLVWYGLSHLTFALLTDQAISQPQFQSIKTQLINSKNPQYLAHMHKLWKINNISLQSQLEVSDPQRRSRMSVGEFEALKLQVERIGELEKGKEKAKGVL